MHTLTMSKSSLLLSLAVSLLLSACGGGGGGGETGSNESSDIQATTSGSVTLVLTDAPDSNFDEINITINKVLLISETGQVPIFTGEQTINLLSLQNFSNVFASEEFVPRGVYSKIRLGLTAITLVTFDDNGEVDDFIAVPIPSNGHIDLKPKNTFQVNQDVPLIIQVDVDANKSIHITETGNSGYRFRPVVFVDILDGSNVGKLVKLQGTVARKSDDGSALVLCQISPAILGYADNNSNRCAIVRIGEDTSIFDVETSLIRASVIDVGDQLTLFARITHMNDVITTSFTSNSLHTPIDIHKHWSLLAEVIELGSHGSFTGLRGVVIDPPAGPESSFPLKLSEGQGFFPGSIIDVLLSDGGKVFLRNGRPVSLGVIQQDTKLLAEGVIHISNEQRDLLRSTILFLETSPEVTKLRGRITAMDQTNNSLDVVTEFGDRCVRTNGDTQYFLVDEDESEQVEFVDLVTGWLVDIYGKEAGEGCFLADTLIAFDELEF